MTKGKLKKLPPPNLKGDYEGSCIVCLKGTDTGLAFVGEEEWAIAGLMHLGIPQDEANGILKQHPYYGELLVRVCKDDAENFPVGIWQPGGSIPKIGQPDISVRSMVGYALNELAAKAVETGEPIGAREIVEKVESHLPIVGIAEQQARAGEIADIARELIEKHGGSAE